MSAHSRWPLTTGVAQGRYYCILRCFRSAGQYQATKCTNAPTLSSAQRRCDCCGEALTLSLGRAYVPPRTRAPRITHPSLMLITGVRRGIIAVICLFPVNRSARIFEHVITLGHAKSSFECPPMLSATQRVMQHRIEFAFNILSWGVGTFCA